MNNNCNLCDFTDGVVKTLHVNNDMKHRIVFYCDIIEDKSFIVLETEVFNDINNTWNILERKYLSYCPNCGRKLNDISVSSD